MRVWDDQTAKIIQAIGGTPVIMSVSETYMALQRGVIDAVMSSTIAFNTLSLDEQAKYLYMANLPAAVFLLSWNQDEYASLPQEYKDVLVAELETLKEDVFREQAKAPQESIDGLVSRGVQQIKLDPEVIDKIKNKVLPLWDEWASAAPQNREALDAVLAEFAK